MQNIRVVFITVPADEAKAMAKGIVVNRHAACVNIVPRTESYFWWDGEVKFEQEALLMVKTTQLALDRLIKFVRDEHPYEVPEIITLPVAEGLPEYLNWVMEETGKDV